jgi:hypothetical protein
VTEIGVPAPDGMATARKAPYVWMTWLAEAMSDPECSWRYWFLSRYQLNEKAQTFDDPAWAMRHGRLVAELDRELMEAGLDPELNYELTVPLDKRGALLVGRIDLLVVDQARRVATVYEAKTGKPKGSHAMQTMLYMYCLTTRPRFRDLGIRGVLVYPDRREDIPGVPSDLPEHFEFYVSQFLSDRPPRKGPGRACRFCPVTAGDCPERVEVDESPAEEEE